MSVYVCSWCGKIIGPAQTPEVSHGICRPCKRRVVGSIPVLQRIKARARLDGWSAVFGQALVYIALGLWALELLRQGVSP